MFNYQQPQNQFGYGAAPMNTMYAPAMPAAKMTQGLTKEQIDELKRNNGAFNLSIDPAEMTKSLCTHKDPQNGQITLNPNDDGTVTCAICGETFELSQKDPQEVEQVTRMFLDILESIKTYYVDIPQDYVPNIFQIEPLIKKIPRLYQIAVSNFNKYDRAGTLDQRNAGVGGFNLYGAIAGQMPYGAPAYGAPAYDPSTPPQLAGFNPGVQTQQQYQAPTPGYNPFAAGQVPYGAQPQAPAYAAPYGAPQVPQYNGQAYQPAPTAYAPQGAPQAQQQQCQNPNHQHNVQNNTVNATDRVSTTKPFK